MSSKMNKKEEVHAAITSIFEAILADNNLEIGQHIQSLSHETKEILSNERNDFWIQCAISQLSDTIAVIRGLSLTNGLSSDLIRGSLERFFERYISITEGSACSSDKAGFICRKIKESIKKNENLSLYADYTGIERIEKEDWNKQAYWSPKTIKDTDEAKRIYIDWLNLKHINPNK